MSFSVLTLSNFPAKFSYKLLTLSVCASLLLAGCGGDDNDEGVTKWESTATTGVKTLTTGQLLDTPQNTKNLSASELKTALEQVDPASANVAGDPVCGVKVEYMHYDTVDAKGTKTDATGAVFIPTGTAAACTGSRPVVLHAHGTATTHGYNFAEVGNAENEAGQRATTAAATFAGQGYVVIAPNFAGYDKSSLSYHPYLNATQQSHEMADALKAGRNVLSQLAATTNVSDNGKLFVTGYSQGGHVAMAAVRYLEQLKEPVVAAMPMSGPYAMSAFGDVVFGGNVMLGGTFFAPLMARSYQEQFGNIYTQPSEMFAPTNADQIATLLPSLTLSPNEIVSTGVLPLSALFQAAPTSVASLDAASPADPAFSFGFDKSNYLIKTDYRANYLADAQSNPDWGVAYLLGKATLNPLTAASPVHPLRQALKANDLRGYYPKMPMVLCGGNQDPSVFFDVNASLVNQVWQNQNAANPSKAVKFAMVDMDISNQATRQKAVYTTQGLPVPAETALKAETTAMQQAFAQHLSLLTQNTTATTLQQGGTQAQADQAAKYAVLTTYHGSVEPYCMNTARAFFNTF